MVNKKVELSDKEAAAIDAVKTAIKGLPRSIHFTVNDFDGVVEFWKRTGPGSAKGVTNPIRCKRAVML